MSSRVFVRDNEAIIIPGDAQEIMDPTYNFRDRSPITRDYSVPPPTQNSGPHLPPSHHYNGPHPMYNAHDGPQVHHPVGHYGLPPVVPACGMMHCHHPHNPMAYWEGPLFMLRVAPPDSPMLPFNAIVEHPNCPHDPPCHPHPVSTHPWGPPDGQAFHPMVTEDETQRTLRKLLSRLERLRQENFELRRELHATRMQSSLIHPSPNNLLDLSRH